MIWLASGCLFGSSYNLVLAADSSTGKSDKSAASTAVNSKRDALSTSPRANRGDSKSKAAVVVRSANSDNEAKSEISKSENTGTSTNTGKSGATKSRSSSKSAAPTSKTSTASKTSTSHRQVRSSQMVPPPPPVVPTFSVGAGMAPSVVLGGELIEYMSTSDLKDLHIKTERDLSKAKARLKEETESIADKQKRALSFQALYAEGVVSRKELELCKKEAETAGSDLEDVKLLVAELEQKFGRIEKRLKELKTKAEIAEKKKKTR